MQAIGAAVFVGQREPAGHCVHVAEPASEYQPVAHAVTDLRSEQSKPAGHDTHCVNPSAEYVPDVHAVTGPVVDAHAEPAGHSEQFAAPPRLYEPYVPLKKQGSAAELPVGQ